jgi:hypothetical protein
MFTSSVRSFRLAVPALLVILIGAVPGHAACDPTTDPDKSDIATARAAVAANCDCAGATSHGAYVSCAAQQANTVLTNKSCAGFVKKCASHSTCGKPGTVTCCNTTAKGTTCKIKKNAAHCIFTGKQGTVGTCTSCCDACPTPGSGPSCPAAPPVCGGGPDASGFCGGSCPTGSTCAATSSTTCGCVPDGQLCNFVSGPPQPMCGGSCPFVTDSCFVVFEASQFRCVCATSCGMQSGVTCPDQPACLPGRTCNPGIGSDCICN